MTSQESKDTGIVQPNLVLYTFPHRLSPNTGQQVRRSGTIPADPEQVTGSALDSDAAYRYERVTIGLLMDDFRFRKDTPSPGDPFPQFELPTTDGGRIRRDDFIGKRPLLIIFGSKSCPLTISSIEPLKRLHRAFGRNIKFVTVNVREAHPGENTRQPVTNEQKLEHARDMQAKFEIPWAVAVDDTGGTLHRALDTKPNAAYLMDKGGKVAFRALFAGDDTNLEQALLSVSRDRPVPKKESSAMLKPMALAIGFISATLKEAGPQAQRDMVRAAPPLILAAKIADLFQFSDISQRGALALTTIAVVMAAIVVAVIGVFV